MSGKGDKPRPLSVDRDTFYNNWDRIFDKSTGVSVTYTETPKPLHEVNYDNMWKHSCTVEMGVMWIGKNETCNYCGAWEEDEL
jgi:hypothetical protein